MAKGVRHEHKAKGKPGKVYGSRGRDKTRSSKPTLIEDPEQEERVLTAQLRQNGLYAANILGDGNCLFRALSDQLYGSPNMHLAIRHEVCDYLSANPDKYRFFVDEDTVKGGFDGHVREMRQPGTYGTNIELSAFVARYRRPVKVYQPGLIYVLPVDENDPPASPGGEASTSSSPPPPPVQTDQKLTAREKRAQAREEKGKGRPVKGGKGKGKQPAVQWNAPEPQPFDGTPLCIVYHSWEHYSSLRNLDGPHTGPPRLRMARVGSPAPPSAQDGQTPEHDPNGEENYDEDVPMSEGGDESVPTAEADLADEPPPPHPPPKPAPPPRLAKDTDSKPLPSVRAALARAQAPSSAHLSPHPHQFRPEFLPPLPPSATPSSSSPPTPTLPFTASTSPADRASPRPPKHPLDRSRPRSPSHSSSSSSSGATSPLHPDDLDAHSVVDENDNDSLSRRLRARRTESTSASTSAGRTTRSRVEQSPALSTSTSASASTGVASATSSGSSAHTRASSPPEEGKGGRGFEDVEEEQEEDERDQREGEQDRGDEEEKDGDEEDDDEEVVVASSRRGASPSPPLPPSSASRKSKPTPRPRRGPTAAERKDAQRQRRMERRRGKGVQAQVVGDPLAGREGGVEAPRKRGARVVQAEADQGGRVLRSGRRTGSAGEHGEGVAALAGVRELYI
ncbi:hypothetical protein JCM8097_000220 [Rhodosporidiobolus ruineniae]